MSNCQNHLGDAVPCKQGSARRRRKIDGKWVVSELNGGSVGMEIKPQQLNRLDEPTLADMATNFAKATAGWVTAGFPVVSESEYDRRLAICRSCQFWDESARLGYGKCNHKSCGCGKGKLWMGSQSCPEKLW